MRHRVVDFAVTAVPAISEIEINPLFVYRDTVCAVDVLLHGGG